MLGIDTCYLQMTKSIFSMFSLCLSGQIQKDFEMPLKGGRGDTQLKEKLRQNKCSVEQVIDVYTRCEAAR